MTIGLKSVKIRDTMRNYLALNEGDPDFDSTAREILNLDSIKRTGRLESILNKLIEDAISQKRRRRGPAGGRYGGGPPSHPRRRRPRLRSLTILQKLATTWPKVWIVVLVVGASGRYGGGEGAGYAGEPAPDRCCLQWGAWEQSELLVRVHLNDTTVETQDTAKEAWFTLDVVTQGF